MIDLKTYEFESPRMGMPADQVLLKEAKERGFYETDSPYNKMFSQMFFNGVMPAFKSGINEAYKEKMWSYLIKFSQSWEPKHEHKEAICALLLSEIAEIK